MSAPPPRGTVLIAINEMKARRELAVDDLPLSQRALLQQKGQVVVSRLILAEAKLVHDEELRSLGASAKKHPRPSTSESTSPRNTRVRIASLFKDLD